MSGVVHINASYANYIGGGLIAGKPLNIGSFLLPKKEMVSQTPSGRQISSCLPEGLKERLGKCGRNFLTKSCPEDGSIVRLRLHCFNRVCVSCLDSRKARALRLLKSYRWPKRVLHCVYGFPRGALPGKVEKANLGKHISRFLSCLREGCTHGKMGKKNIKLGGVNRFLGLRVLDINSDSGGVYLHYHAALWWEKKIDVRAMRGVLLRHGIKFFKVIGWKSSRAIIKYFAKRLAGEYELDGKSATVQEIVSEEEFSERVYRMRSLVVLGGRNPDNPYFLPPPKAGQSCIIGQFSPEVTCPKCGGELENAGIEHIGGYWRYVWGAIPPPLPDVLEVELGLSPVFVSRKFAPGGGGVLEKGGYITGRESTAPGVLFFQEGREVRGFRFVSDDEARLLFRGVVV